MRATSLSLANRNLIAAAEALRERESKVLKRETCEEEESEETRGCVGRANGRGRRVRWPAGGKGRRRRRGRAADFGKINRRAGKKLLDREQHACRKKCNVLFRRRDTGCSDGRELRSQSRRSRDSSSRRTRPTRSEAEKQGKGEEKRIYYIALKRY